MVTKIDGIISGLLEKVLDADELDQELIQKTLGEVRNKLNLGSVFVLAHTEKKRDYHVRWIDAADENFEVLKESIHINAKDLKDILVSCAKDPVYTMVFEGRGVRSAVSTLSYGFLRTANCELNGAIGFAAAADHEWTEDEENALRKLGRTFYRILSPEMLLELDIDLKLARTKVDIYRHYTEMDALTQIPNRNYFINFCKEYVEREKRPNVGFVFADLNRLKFINDTMGHPEGDTYITDFAQKLSKCFNAATVCRISGDEFIACTIKDSKEDFEKRVERLKNENIYRGVPQASLGITWHEQPENIKDVMNEAEALMYTNKQEFYLQYPEYKR